MMKQQALFFMVVAALLFTASCTSTVSNVPSVTPTIVSKGPEIDSGLFSKSLCKPPCWQNLTPGKSSTNDVDRFIKSLGVFEWPDKTNHPYKSGCIWKMVLDSKKNHAADFFIENETLTFIQWTMPPEITLQQIVNHYGPPQYFQATLSTEPEDKLYVIEVYYPILGMAFKVAPRKEDVNYILPNMRITTVQYFAGGDINTYFIARYSCSYGPEIAANETRNEILNYIQSWSGFGEIKVIPAP